MYKLPKTKIVCTIGPSSWKDDVLKEMIAQGMQVARINASFADFKEAGRVAEQIRKLSPRVAVMLDTKGHKIRVTGFEQDRYLRTGKQIAIVPEGFEEKGDDIVEITYKTLHKDISRGAKILFDDGNIQLKVVDLQGEKVICEIIAGAMLKKRKTVNIPGVHLNFPGLSKKDKQDIRFAVQNNFDYVSASFIRNKEDVALIRKEMGETKTKLIAKVEDYEGVQNFDEILEVVDGIMVARGDLGTELPMEQVPILQKQFILKCRMVGKPVIVATQMLESMRNSKRPTRAEVSDIANAIMDGADAIMLSAETSTGKYPVDVVRTMREIAIETENVLLPQPIVGRTAASIETDTICNYINPIANELDLKGVIIFTQTGITVRSLSRHRLKIPIWSLSTEIGTIRQMSMIRGVTGYHLPSLPEDRDEAIRKGVETVYSHGNLNMTDRIAIMFGSAIVGRHNNSILEIVSVNEILR